jgi:hypothetical protein
VIVQKLFFIFQRSRRSPIPSNSGHQGYLTGITAFDRPSTNQLVREEEEWNNENDGEDHQSEPRSPPTPEPHDLQGGYVPSEDEEEYNQEETVPNMEEYDPNHPVIQESKKYLLL